MPSSNRARRRAMQKRSAAITLVLAGGLAGCGGEPIPQQDAYRSLDDCVRDWNNAAQCQPVRDNRYASSYYYGPTYFGNRYGDGRPRPSPNAMDTVDRPRGTPVTGTRSSTLSSFFGGSSHSTGSSGISGSGRSTTSAASSSSSSSTRSGFGSTASARSSSS